MNDSQDNLETTSTSPESEGRKPQCSIGKTLLWTAVIAGGLTVVKVSEPNSIWDPWYQVLKLSLYIVVVCGILSFFRDPKSFDVWFPTGMNVFIPVVLLLFDMDTLVDICYLLAMGGLPYGIFFLGPNVHRIERREFSISILVYHLGSWLGWTLMWTASTLSAGGA